VGMDLVEVAAAGTTVDLTVQAASEEHVSAVTRALEEAHCRVRHVSDRTFLYHLGGKIEVTPRVAMRTRQDLSLAYTPGVGRVASAIARRPSDAWSLTAKGTSVAIATDGTAVLGLGALGPLAALPVMEGKAILFKHFGGLNAYPICLDTKSPEALVDAVAAISPGFGGINLEDIAAPNCFEVEAELQRRLDIPVFHDDQHGTAVVTLAALRNACKIVGKDLSRLRVVLSGAGAAGVAITKILMSAGVSDIVATDRQGAVHKGREGLDLETMADGSIVFALANPVPEVLPEEAEGVVAVMATGRSDYPNQINNVLCFPGIFRGALDAGATTITENMKLAAADAIAAAVPPEELKAEEIVPSVFVPGVAESVARAVADAARAEGVIRP
jgi:malate dehydrogenase (oxaloacetate-decarboxylating)